ncbi:MAG TPA: hypothetical protein VGW40_02020 [Allosphingosinicella sp.]|nr:hypothetical protein [Allosphingosinicella sp.]
MGKKKSGGRTGPKGSIARASGKDGPQIVHSDGHRWTDEAEEIFLDSLAASNNARWSADQCGFSTAAIYARARRDPGFHERMAAARAIARDRIDEGLYRAAEDFLAGKPADPDAPLVVTSVDQAIAIQKLNRPPESIDRRRPAWPARPRTLDEMRGSILKKLSAIARKRGLI